MSETTIESGGRGWLADLLGDVFIGLVVLGVGTLALAGSYIAVGLVVQTLTAGSGLVEGDPSSHALVALAGLALVQFLNIVRQFWLEFPSMLRRWLENNHREMLLFALVALMSGIVLTI